MVFRDKRIQDNTILTPAGSGNGNNLGTGFALAESQTDTAITDLNFGSTIRSFIAQVSVSIDATTDVSEVFQLMGVFDGSDWHMTTVSTGGTSTDITFGITSGGQVNYTSSTWVGFVSGVLYFKYQTTPR